MDDKYIYHGNPRERVFGPLPAGDYNFNVASIDAPYFKNDKWILPLKITIQPQGITVFANPWAGTNSYGEERDGIAEFLLSINRVPAVGQEPQWGKMVGARGRCRLKLEIAQKGVLTGKDVNKVAWFHAPKQLEASELPQVGPKPPQEPDELDMGEEPKNIPF